MRTLTAIAKRLQSGERVVPARWRLPLRYRMQRLVGGFEPEMHILGELVRPGGVALDIGANHGIYAYALAGIASRVHCFEPLSECCAYIRAARSDKIVVHNCALSDAAGKLRLYIPTTHGRPIGTRASLAQPAGSFEVRDVDVRTLDSMELPPVDFVKIDVEGVEAALLRGARAMLERDHPGMLIEIDRARHSRESFESLIAWLNAQGYEPHVLETEGLRRSEEPWADASNHMNFLFPGRWRLPSG